MSTSDPEGDNVYPDNVYPIRQGQMMFIFDPPLETEPEKRIRILRELKLGLEASEWKPEILDFKGVRYLRIMDESTNTEIIVWEDGDLFIDGARIPLDMVEFLKVYTDQLKGSP